MSIQDVIAALNELQDFEDDASPGPDWWSETDGAAPVRVQGAPIGGWEPNIDRGDHVPPVVREEGVEALAWYISFHSQRRMPIRVRRDAKAVKEAKDRFVKEWLGDDWSIMSHTDKVWRQPRRPEPRDEESVRSHRNERLNDGVRAAIAEHAFQVIAGYQRLDWQAIRIAAISAVDELMSSGRPRLKWKEGRYTTSNYVDNVLSADEVRPSVESLLAEIESDVEGKIVAPSWGIFIRAYGVEVVAVELQRAAGLPADEAFRQAWIFLYEHELTHYRNDLLVAQTELASRRGLYTAPKYLRHSGLHEYEEALANATARSFLKPKAALDDWMSKCPPGYRDWRAADIKDGWRTALGNATSGVHLPVTWAPASNTRPPFEGEIPVYLIPDTANSVTAVESLFVGPVAVEAETPTFVKDLKRLAKGQPRVRKQWEKTKAMMLAGNLTGSTHLEKVVDPDLYSARLDQELRVGLRRDPAGWQAVAADHHDALYRRLHRGV